MKAAFLLSCLILVSSCASGQRQPSRTAAPRTCGERYKELAHQSPAKQTQASGSDSPDGGLAKEEIARVVRHRLPEIKACYESHLVDDPTAEGYVTSFFVVGSGGWVIEQNVRSNMASSVIDCVVAQVNDLKFPPPTGGGTVLVVYPFIFCSTEADDGGP